jgi:hypothetical protein
VFVVVCFVVTFVVFYVIYEDLMERRKVQLHPPEPKQCLGKTRTRKICVCYDLNWYLTRSLSSQHATQHATPPPKPPNTHTLSVFRLVKIRVGRLLCKRSLLQPRQCTFALKQIAHDDDTSKLRLLFISSLQHLHHIGCIGLAAKFALSSTRSLSSA